jgi:hypothetical protein
MNKIDGLSLIVIIGIAIFGVLAIVGFVIVSYDGDCSCCEAVKLCNSQIVQYNITQGICRGIVDCDKLLLNYTNGCVAINQYKNQVIGGALAIALLFISACYVIFVVSTSKSDPQICCINCN